MIRLNIYITDEQKALLKSLSTNSTSLSEHIRNAINEYLVKKISNKTTVSPSKKGLIYEQKDF